MDIFETYKLGLPAPVNFSPTPTSVDYQRAAVTDNRCSSNMKLFIVLSCIVALAAARPGYQYPNRGGVVGESVIAGNGFNNVGGFNGGVFYQIFLVKSLNG